MTSNKNTRILHNINCDEMVLDTNNDAKNLHFNIRTIGPVGQNDVEFKTCNVKVNDGDFFTDVIKDLDGNEFVNLSGANHVIKDVSGDPIITIGDSEIDFHSATVNNLTLGSLSLDTSDIQSINYVGENLEHELDAIHTNITGKLAKDGQTVNKILTTSSGGVIQFTQPVSKLTDITNNTTAIGTIANLDTTANNLTEAVNELHTEINTNTSNISSNTSSISTNTTDITDISNSVTTNTTNIALNTGNVATALSNISTLDNTTLKLDETQTISGYNFYDTSSELSVSSNRFHIYNNANDTRAYFTHSYAGNVTLTLPSSTGTLSLKSPVDTNTTNIATNTSDIATKLPLAGGTLTGALIGTTSQMNGSQSGTVFMGSSATYNFQIDDAPLGNPAETYAINFDTGFNPDAFFVGTTTATDVRLGTNNSTRIQIASGGDITTYNQLTIQGATHRDFSSSDTDITAQLPSGSSAFGHIIEGRTFGHLVLGIRRNDGKDSVTIASTDASGSTYATSVARFRADGIVEIDNSLYIGDIHLGQTNEINIDSGMYLQDDGSGLTNDDCYICRNGGTLRVGGTIVPTSDDRLKHNEVDISGAINIIKQLTPKKYFKSSIPYEANNNFAVDSSGNYVDNSGNVVKGVFESGLIAQEVMNTDLAFLVSGGGVKEKIDASGNVIQQDLMYGVNYNGLHAYTIKAIQELETQNSLLKSKVEVLESKVAQEQLKTAYFEMKINNLYSHLNL